MDENEEDPSSQKNMTAEQARENKQLNKLNDNELNSRPDEKLALEAKLFVALEAQENARRVEREREFANIKVAPMLTELLAKETRLEKQEAEKLLKSKKGDFKNAMIEFIKSFPQIELCREPSNVLGL